MSNAVTITNNSVTINLDEIIRRKGARGRRIVHSDERYRNSNDNLADVLQDLMAYAAVDEKDFDNELATARRWMEQDTRRKTQKSEANAAQLNACVAQNAAIIQAIHKAEEAESLQAALDLLVFATPLWDACGYGYKVREVSARILARTEFLIADEEEYLACARKNCKTRAMTEKNLVLLRVIRDKVK